MANELVVELLDSIVDSLDIPESYYRRAADRHRSLGEWLCRRESKVAEYSPHVTPQGSFRYGTVIRPLNAAGEYDLDNVVTLTLLKTAMTQKQLKTLFGEEIQAYAEAHQMLSPLEEMNRCWRLHYADEVTFHLDTLPCIAEEESVIAAIMGLGVPRELARRAVAITDKRHPYYALISSNLLSSNPRGFARWFEERTRVFALPHLRRLVESRLYSSVEDVPAYEWKTPLQRSIQVLKRHRDVMFEGHPELAPISMIITNLATHAYNGEPDIFTAVTGIVQRMTSFIRAGWPRVPNPADPAEDYADKWSKDPQLEQNFRAWHTQAKADLARLPDLLRRDRLAASVRQMFRLYLSEEQLRQFQPVPAYVRSPSYASPAIAITSAPKPWGNRLMRASTMLKWGVEELLRKYPDLRLQPAASGNTITAGTLEFSAQTRGQKLVSDRYEISISLPPEFPRSIPMVREMAQRIPPDFTSSPPATYAWDRRRVCG